ncbi:MAG: cyclodeaminase/cyclohydrolase family protein [Clostridiales bacterium]|nr:cyclodeaminase/cyclohydrolase family protein [Clostridiales bacterium]
MGTKINKEWFDELSSGAPTPGGGGASALAGAAGASLGMMVSNLTVGKKKYAAVEPEIKEYLAALEKLRDDMLELIEKDAEVFAPLAAAYSLPSSTPEEKAEKEKVMASVLKSACQVPLEIMGKGYEILKIVKELALKGSVMAVSDAGVASQFARTAVLGASMNVFINTKTMKDRELAEEYNAKAEKLNLDSSMLADEIFASVEEGLKCR